MHARSRAFALVHVRVLTVGIFSAAVIGPLPAGAQTAQQYSGSAVTDLVHVEELIVPNDGDGDGDGEVDQLSLAPSLSEMSSAGLTGGGNAHARATNLDVDL